MQRRLSCAYLTPLAKGSSRESSCQNLPMKFGMVYVPGLKPGAVYGYRVYGPYEPEKGHRFNHNKLLLDPYARAHIGELKWAPELFGYQMESGDDLTFDERDSAPFVQKCLVVDSNYSWKRAQSPWSHGTTPSSTRCTSEDSPSCILM